VLSTHGITDPPNEIAADQLAKLADWTFPALQQGVRDRWDGEQTYGMLERSSPMDNISR
jgi:hypothetical protein